MTQIGAPKRIIEIPLPSERPSQPSVEPSPDSPTRSPEPSKPTRTPAEPLVPA